MIFLNLLNNQKSVTYNIPFQYNMIRNIKIPFVIVQA